MRRILALAAVFVGVESFNPFAPGRRQSAAINGRLMCGDVPAADVEVKLFDEDVGLDSDDLLGKTKTDKNGEFAVQGFTRELLTMDPKFSVYHNCNDNKPCQRKFTVHIPQVYVSVGETPHVSYYAGVIQLMGIFDGEQRDCVH